MAKTLQVKVKTSVLVEALNKALAERTKRYADGAKREAEYDKQMNAYRLSMMKLIKSPKATVTEARHYQHWASKDNEKQEVSVTLMVPKALLPKEPERPVVYYEHDYKRDLEEITNAIRILSMTEQEFVNASTLASVSKFL